MHEKIETIRELAHKLSALSDPTRGGTPAECAIAAAKLKHLLEKHGLTIADLENSDTDWLYLEVVSKNEHELLIQCICFVLNQSQISISRIPKPAKSRYPEEVGIKVTRLHAADIRACFAFYRQILADRTAELENEIAKRRAAIKSLPDAIFSRYHIFPHNDNSESDKPDLTPAQLAALLTAMAGLDGDAWQRPAASLSGLALEYEQRA